MKCTFNYTGVILLYYACISPDFSVALYAVLYFVCSLNLVTMEYVVLERYHL